MTLTIITLSGVEERISIPANYRVNLFLTDTIVMKNMTAIQIKRSSKEFKELKSIISDYLDEPGSRRSILLYALKPYLTLSHKVLLNNRKQNAAVLYALAYGSLHDYFLNPLKKLFRDPRTGVYFFKNNSASKWIEVPFELTGKLKKQVQPLSVVR